MTGELTENPADRREDSLRKRYLYKLVSSGLGMGIGFITTGVTLRGLGPVNYGNFNFLSNFFTQAVGFLDMGTSIGFFSKLSHRKNEKSLVAFYFLFVCAATAALGALIIAALNTKLHEIIWPGQGAVLVGMMALWGVLTWVSQILGKMTDAYGLTVKAEVVKVIQRAAGLLLVGAFFWFGALTLKNYVFCQYIAFAILVVMLLRVMAAKGHLNRGEHRLSSRQIRDYSREFYDYSHPLLVSGLAAMLFGMLDRWFLQVFGGSAQQGFYGMSYTVGSFCFLFAGAMQPLLMREFSIAHGAGDRKKMAELFRRYIPLLYGIVVFFSCFIAAQAKQIILIFGGVEYEHALTPVIVMAFYPVYQTYGQLSGSVFYATGQTRIYRNISVTFGLIGLPLTFFLLAPGKMGGIAAGATGLAVKTLALAFLSVNVQLYFNSRMLDLSFYRFLLHQVGVLVWMLLLAYGAVFASGAVGAWGRGIPAFVFSGILYSILVGVCVYRFPVLLGLQKRDIQKFVNIRYFRRAFADTGGE